MTPRRQPAIVGLVAKLHSVTWSDLVEMARALGTAIMIEIGLRAVKTPTLARLIGVPLRTQNGQPGVAMLGFLPDWAMRRLYISSRLMDHWPFGGTCLRRSLLTGQRLRALRPTLRIGVARPGTALEAHAWIEIDGQFFDPQAADFSPLAETLS